MRVLITGANGRVGRVLCEGLKHHTLFKLDCATEGGDDDLVCADIANKEALERAIASRGALDAVIHLAANPRVDASWEELVAPNILGAHNLYACVRQFKIPRVVFASTNRVSGMAEGEWHEGSTLITTNDPVRPDGDYAVTKVFGEALARFYHDAYGIASICLRLGSVMQGDDPRGDARRARTWLSYRDCVALFEGALTTPVTYGIYYGVSDNPGRFWDIEQTRRDLGFEPKDSSARL